MSDVYHTLSCTIGVRATRKADGTVAKVHPGGIWSDRPDLLPKDVSLIRLEIEIPESLFGFQSLAKG